jgi:hypothetical protein
MKRHSETKTKRRAIYERNWREHTEFKVISCHVESVCGVEIKFCTCTEMSDNSKHLTLLSKYIGRVADKLIFDQLGEAFCGGGGGGPK